MSTVRQWMTKTWPDLASLLLRLAFGIGMAAAHGWPKATKFDDLQSSFPDPLGVGSSSSLVLVIFAELVCAVAVTVGLYFRLALVPLIITMAVAAFVIHGGDPFQKQELSLAYFSAYVALILMGPGRLSIDAWRSKRS